MGRIVGGVAAFATLVALLGGVPWALWRYIGWPLPHDLPDWGDLQAVLTGPLTTQHLVDILAVLCWISWIAFLIDVIRTLPAAVRAAAIGTPRPAIHVRSEPLHALAAVLVSAVVVAVLGHRPEPPVPPTAVAASHLPAGQPEDTMAHAVVHRRAAATITQQSGKTVVVREPRNGVHDCLWRIADRELRDGARWPEIYRLNHARPQPDGRALTNPNLIYPGWILLLPGPVETKRPSMPGRDRSNEFEHKPTTPARPTDTSSPEPAATPSATPATPTPTWSSSPSVTAQPSQAPPRPTTPAAPDDANHQAQGPGIDAGTGVFLGLGIAAAVSTALLAVRRRRRRWYPPGSGHRSDLPVAPVVRTLRIAHLQAFAATDADDTPRDHQNPGSEDSFTVGDAGNGHPKPSSPTQRTSARPTVLPVGVRDGQVTALDLARGRGLGLVGPGAAGAARALLLGLLTTTTARMLVPKPDLAELVGASTAEIKWPTRLQITPDLDSALDTLESEILHRARLSDNGHAEPPSATPLLVLIAIPDPGIDKRLQGVLGNGSTLGLAGILLGQWRPGATAHVRLDGHVSATNPGHAEQLRGARLFTLPAPDTVDLLALLHDGDDADHADDGSPPRQSGTDKPPASTDVDKAPRGVPPTPTSTHSDSDPDHADRNQKDGGGVDALSLTILGPTQMVWRPDGSASRSITSALSPRQLELIVFLALHRDGVVRDTLADTLWPDGPTERPFNALHTTLSRLRRTLKTATDASLSELITMGGDRYQLDLVDVDYWRFINAVAASRAATTDAARTAAYRQIIACYRGELAAGMHAEWLDVPREATRRDAIDAATHLARLLVNTDPERALHLLESARGFDPYNELIYRDIMRLQARLEQDDAVSRTLTLLTTRLAELDEQPDPATIALATELQGRSLDQKRPQRRVTTQ